MDGGPSLTFVLLALLSGSILTGVAAFLFSTVVITLFAEIAPQAYFSRHALPIAAALAPVLRVYPLLLYPIARPTAWVLDRWLGGEEIRFFRERDSTATARSSLPSPRVPTTPSCAAARNPGNPGPS
jgi:CBS domain containing-hemolysin-like protein